MIRREWSIVGCAALYMAIDTFACVVLLDSWMLAVGFYPMILVETYKRLREERLLARRRL